MNKKTQQISELKVLIKKIGLLIDIREYLSLAAKKTPTQIYQNDGILKTWGKKLKNNWNSSTYNDAIEKFNKKINTYNDYYSPCITNKIAISTLDTMVESESNIAFSLANDIFDQDKYGLAKLQFVISLIFDSTYNFDHQFIMYRVISCILNEEYEYMDKVKKELLKAYQSISVNNSNMTNIRLTAGLLTGLVILCAINPAIGGIAASGATTTASLGGLFFGAGMAESVLLLCGTTALTYAALEIGLTQADKFIQRKKIKEEFYKLSVDETAFSLAQTIIMIVQINKFRGQDSMADKLYTELIDNYIDVKSDIALKMFLSDNTKTDFEKNKIFQKVDDYLFKKLQTQ